MKNLKWNLILKLSMFGLAIAIATLYWISSSIEPYFWLAILLICAYLIAKFSESKPFLHGFFVCILNSVWVTSAHIIFFGTYIAHHPEQAAMMQSNPMPVSHKTLMLITGALIGIITGLILGLFSVIANKIIKKKG
ncbi:MAG: hypothetical protein HW421_3278 [Ignavibacteria bacterium]|nr:hypothetical protein [Ignavibacteria bacterium]